MRNRSPTAPSQVVAASIPPQQRLLLHDRNVERLSGEISLMGINSAALDALHQILPELAERADAYGPMVEPGLRPWEARALRARSARRQAGRGGSAPDLPPCSGNH